MCEWSEYVAGRIQTWARRGPPHREMLPTGRHATNPRHGRRPVVPSRGAVVQCGGAVFVVCSWGPVTGRIPSWARRAPPHREMLPTGRRATNPHPGRRSSEPSRGAVSCVVVQLVCAGAVRVRGCSAAVGCWSGCAAAGCAAAGCCCCCCCAHLGEHGGLLDRAVRVPNPGYDRARGGRTGAPSPKDQRTSSFGLTRLGCGEYLPPVPPAPQR